MTTLQLIFRILNPPTNVTIHSSSYINLKSWQPKKRNTPPSHLKSGICSIILIIVKRVSWSEFLSTTPYSLCHLRPPLTSKLTSPPSTAISLLRPITELQSAPFLWSSFKDGRTLIPQLPSSIITIQTRKTMKQKSCQEITPWAWKETFCRILGLRALWIHLYPVLNKPALTPLTRCWLWFLSVIPLEQSRTSRKIYHAPMTRI